MSITAIYKGGGGGGLKINAQTRQITPGIQLNKGDVVYMRYVPVETATTNITNAPVLSMSRDGKYIAYAQNGGSLAVYRRNSDNSITQLNISTIDPPIKSVYGCSLSADGTYLATSSSSSDYYGIRVFKNVNDSYTQVSNNDFPPFVYLSFGQVSLSKNAEYLAAVGNNDPSEKRLVLFKRTEGTDTFVKIWDFSDRGYDMCAISPDGRYVTITNFIQSGYAGANPRIYRRDDNNNAVELNAPTLGRFFKFSDDSKKIYTNMQVVVSASAYTDHRVFNIESNDSVTEAFYVRTYESTKSCFFQNDKKLVFNNKLYNIQNGYYNRRFEIDISARSFEISNDSRYYAISRSGVNVTSSIGIINQVFSKEIGQYDEVFIAKQACDGTNTIDAYVLTDY